MDTAIGRLWVLGASDPEMQAIESVLIDGGEQIAYATVGASLAATKRRNR